MTNEEFLNRRAATCIELYGFDSPMKNPDILHKREQTRFDKYGPEGRKASAKTIAAMMTDSTKVDNYMLFKEDPAHYIQTHYDNKPTIPKLEADLGVNSSTIYIILNKYDCGKLIEHYYSEIETEVYGFLKSIVPNTKIIRNSRSVIRPYEVDLYLPEYSFAIECNPTFTHNSSFKSIDAPPVPYTYHQMKSKLAKENNVFLFHIFGYEWNLKRDIIKSMIQNILHVNTKR